MSQPRATDRVLADIERRLFEPLGVAGLAGKCGLSPFHFSRLFTAATGESVMAYVRRRRLVAAARRLLDEPGLAPAHLALDCGFESQQAFTRAFTRLFGVSPGRFRRAGGSGLSAQGEPFMIQPVDVSASLRLVDGLSEPGPFRLAGLSNRFNQDNAAAIPGLWTRLAPRLPLAGQQGPEAYGACVSGEDGGFQYMAGVRVGPDAAAPEGLEIMDAPAQTYAVFRLTLTGQALHPQMASAAKAIWGERLQATGLKPSGGPDFEYYPADFDENRPGATVEFWVPVQV